MAYFLGTGSRYQAQTRNSGAVGFCCRSSIRRKERLIFTCRFGSPKCEGEHLPVVPVPSVRYRTCLELFICSVSLQLSEDSQDSTSISPAVNPQFSFDPNTDVRHSKSVLSYYCCIFVSIVELLLGPMVNPPTTRVS